MQSVEGDAQFLRVTWLKKRPWPLPGLDQGGTRDRSPIGPICVSLEGCEFPSGSLQFWEWSAVGWREPGWLSWIPLRSLAAQLAPDLAQPAP